MVDEGGAVCGDAHVCEEQPVHVCGTLRWEENECGSFCLELGILGRNSKKLQF